MINNGFKKALEELVSLVGKREAQRLLVIAKVSIHTSAKLVGGDYKSEIGALLGDAILAALNAAKESRAS